MATRKRVRKTQPPAETPVVHEEGPEETTGLEQNTGESEAPEPETHEEPVDSALVEEPKPADGLGMEAYIRTQEQAAALHGVVVVDVSHPEGTDSVFPGRDGGIRITRGEQSSRWSDGSKH